MHAVQAHQFQPPLVPMPAPIAPAYVDPAHVQSTPTPSTTRKKPPSQASKRKRIDTSDDGGGGDSSPKKQREGSKKKKANRACFHCQKAHLTCDDSRPCQRCIKRGFANNCTEGLRKKAKYLLDDNELEQLKRSKSVATTEPTSEQPAVAYPFPPADPMLNISFDPNFPFGSEAANLEYSILSAILGNPSPPESIGSPPSSQHAFGSWSADSLQYTSTASVNSFATSFSDSPMSLQPSDTSLTSPHSTYVSYSTQQNRSTESFAPTSFRPSQNIPLHPLQPRYPLPPDYSRSPTAATSSTVFTRPDPQEPCLLSPSTSHASPLSHATGQDSVSTPTTPSSVPKLPSSHSSTGVGSQLQSINDRVTVPYDYTEGYHFLMKHLPSRFEKNDILRIVRALAIFRPSLIALQMPLSLDDEIFVEKCFQRTLLELDKLISYSGTPTVVWRRTGEICLVAPEFCMLTEWPMEELVGRKKYIYELFENQSVVEYWENFAEHAFENATQSVYSHCVLLKPSGAPVPCTFCFSIRRDLFDLPSIVIGQWLPLL